MSRNRNPYKANEWDGKPYNFFGDYLWKSFKGRVLKLPINANLNCPNRDGTVGSDGCIFCSEEGSASPTCSGSDAIRDQMRNARESFKRADGQTRYIAYFQAFSNTYAPVERLRSIYDTALLDEDIVGLMIATRPDCVPDDVLDLIASYRKDNFELWLELGMQSMHDRSLAFMQRGHTHALTRSAVERAAERGIKICAHLILGVPGETWEDMMGTAHEASALPVQGVKLHHLHVIKGTALESMYARGEVPLLSFREYVSAICDFIERLRPDILIHRLSGDQNEEMLVAPAWGMHKGTVLKEIEDEFRRRGTYQGFLYD